MSGESGGTAMIIPRGASYGSMRMCIFVYNIGTSAAVLDKANQLYESSCQ